jgi:hypothetical protein
MKSPINMNVYLRAFCPKKWSEHCAESAATDGVQPRAIGCALNQPCDEKNTSI